MEFGVVVGKFGYWLHITRLEVAPPWGLQSDQVSFFSQVLQLE